VAKSTGPLLALGGITIVNRSILHDEPFDLKVPIATGLLAAGFALVEKAVEPLAVGLAWLALVTVLLTRIEPNVPSPVESLETYFKS
jgi:hypothetical protein